MEIAEFKNSNSERPIQNFKVFFYRQFFWIPKFTSSLKMQIYKVNNSMLVTKYLSQATHWLKS